MNTKILAALLLALVMSPLAQAKFHHTDCMVSVDISNNTDNEDGFLEAQVYNQLIKKGYTPSADADALTLSVSLDTENVAKNIFDKCEAVAALIESKEVRPGDGNSDLVRGAKAVRTRPIHFNSETDPLCIGALKKAIRALPKCVADLPAAPQKD